MAHPCPCQTLYDWWQQHRWDAHTRSDLTCGGSSSSSNCISTCTHATQLGPKDHSSANVGQNAAAERFLPTQRSCVLTHMYACCAVSMHGVQEVMRYVEPVSDLVTSWLDDSSSIICAVTLGLRDNLQTHRHKRRLINWHGSQ